MSKIRKTLCSIAFMFVVAVTSMILTACHGAAVKLELKPESIDTTVLVNTEHDLSDLVVKVTYEDDEVEEIEKNDDMEITPIDTSKLGKQTLTIKYLDLKLEVEINVVAHESDTYTVIGFEKPEFYTLFEDSKEVATPDASTTATESYFAVGTYDYKVGDDNKFKFLPIITAVNDEGDDVTLPEYTSIVTVKENGTELTGTALTNVVAIDNAESTFDFTDSAIGHTYEITVQPMEIPEDATFSPITFKVKVVDGWNVYTVADLSRVEDNAQTTEVWAAKKQQTGIDNTKVAAVVLHNNLVIKKSDLPTGFFHPADTQHEGEDISGTLVDSTSFFTRDIPVGETFSIYGNYFNISTQNEGTDKVPMVQFLDHDGKFGHAAVFAFGGDNTGSPDDPQGNVYIESLSMKGNGSREGGTNPNNHRGLIGILTTAQNTTLENCLTRAFTTHIITLDDGYVDGNALSCDIKNTKMVDSFQAMICAWASRNNNIINSVMKDSGGSLIVSTHVDADEGSTRYANVTVQNSILESVVTGGEAWFVKNQADAIVANLKAFNAVIQGFSQIIMSQDIGVDKVASFVRDGKLNFLVINMEDDTISNDAPIASKTTIKDAEGNIIAEQDMINGLMAKFVEFNPAFSTGNVLGVPFVFECGGSYVTFDINKDASVMQSALAILIDDDDVKAITGQSTGYSIIPISLDSWEDHKLFEIPEVGDSLKAMVQEKIANFFNGDFVNMYLGGQSLGCTFEMYHLDV